MDQGSQDRTGFRTTVGGGRLGSTAAAKAARSAKADWTLLAALLPVVAATVGFGGVYSYVWAPVDLVLFAALALTLWRRVRANASLPSHPLLAPIVGFGLLVVAQWALGFSLYRGATLTGLVQLAGCGAAFYLMLCAARQPGAVAALGRAVWVFCGALALEAILQAFGANGYIYWFHYAGYGTPVGPFVYHNAYAGCVELLLPVAAVYAFRSDRHSRGASRDPLWVRRALRGLVPALAVGSVVISRSRGGMLIVGFEAVLGIIVFWSEVMRTKRTRIALIAGTAAALTFSALANWGPIARRFSLLAHHDASAVERLAVAGSCWHIFLAHPWLGTGLGTFSTVYPAYQTFDSGLAFDYAHNDYAQALAETGAVGAACVLLFLILWADAFLRLRRQPHAGQTQQLRIACFIATAGLLAHSFGDFEFHIPANALLFFLLLGAACAAPASPHGSGTTWRSNAARAHPLP